MRNVILTVFAALTATRGCSAADEFQAAIERLGRLEGPPRLSAELRARIVASLPAEGEVTALTANQREKLDAVTPVLKAHGREGDYLVKVVRARQARLAIYARSVVLITDTALRLLSARQIQALVSHEIGHDYVWEEFEEARKRSEFARMRELELVCDGVAIQTLHRMGEPVSALIDGLRLMTKSDLANGIEADDRSHPSIVERARFARRVMPR